MLVEKEGKSFEGWELGRMKGSLILFECKKEFNFFTL
jgi:hypothetical protein